MIPREILHLLKTGIEDRVKIEVRLKSLVIGWNLACFIFCFLIPGSQPRPIDRPYYSVDRLQTFNHGNSSSSIVRVIVSSSSSSSRSSSVGGGGKGHSFQRPNFHDLPLPTPTLSPIRFHPTTHHPQLPPFLTTFRQQQHPTRPRLFQQHHPPQLLPRPQHLIQRANFPHQQSKDHIFSAFYRTFPHQSGATFALPSYTSSLLPTAQLVSIVSETQSVSTSEVPYKQKPTNRNPSGEAQQIQRRYDLPQMLDQIHDEPQPFQAPSLKPTDQRHDVEVELPRAEPLVMYQGDQLYDFQSDQPITTTPPTQLASKNWGEPEKVWAEPEKVWGSPEMNWEGEEVTEKWESGKEDLGTLTPTTLVTTGETDEDSSVRFYELGEDENDEPKELILDKNAMQTTIESAQLAARSWELPELNHMTHIPSQSFVRSGAMTDGMTAESVQIPTTLSMPKVRMTLDSGVKGKSIINSSQDERSSPFLQASTNQNSGKKFGYVLDGSNVRKYRVEERTPDGYIVGEYGVLNHKNGFLRGVRYTADGTINPRLIHEALMKFLSL